MLRVGFNIRYLGRFKPKILKVIMLAFLQVSLVCVPVLAFAQLPIVTLTLGDESASEAGPVPGSFIVTRTGSTTAALQVKVKVTGTAIFGTDYTADPVMVYQGGGVYRVTIPADQLTTTIVITPIPDGKLEDEETAIFTLEADNLTYTVGPEAMVEVTIADDTPELSLTVDDGAAAEAGPDPGGYIITRSDSGIISAALKVKVQVTGTARFDTDYTADPRMVYQGGGVYRVTIPADQLTTTITITPIPDGKLEDEETAIFTLVADNLTYTVGPEAVAQVNIADDTPELSLIVDDGAAAEAGPDPGSYIITRSDSGIISAALQVKVQVTGTAKIGTDYSSDPAMVNLGGGVYRVTIPADQLTITITITPVQDGKLEDEETAIFTLVADNAIYTVGVPLSASITIADYVEGIFKDSFEDP